MGKPSRARTKTASGLGKLTAKRALTDIRYFFRSTDWSALWSEWYLEVDEKNRPRWKTIRHFVTEHTESEEQHAFMMWYLGPVSEEEDADDKKYKHITRTPVDWARRRDTHGWFNEETVAKYTVEIRRKMFALDAMREAGNQFPLKAMFRFSNLADQLDKDMKCILMAPGLTLKDQEARAQFYLDMHRQLLAMQEKAQDLYARSHGVDFSDLTGLVTLMQASQLSQVATTGELAGPQGTRGVRTLGKLVDMMAEKHSRFNTPMPAMLEVAAEEVLAEEEVRPARKKNGGLQ